VVKAVVVNGSYANKVMLMTAPAGIVMVIITADGDVCDYRIDFVVNIEPHKSVILLLASAL